MKSRANSHAIAIGATIVLLAALSVSADAGMPPTTSSVNVQKLPSPDHAVMPALPEPAVSYPTATPEVCGYWTATYAEMARRYGELRNCMPVDPARSAWVITTVGTTSTHGVIAVYQCASAACRDGRNNHPIRGWRIYPGPFAGGVTVLGHTAKFILIVSNGGHQITFDVATGRYRV
jgi:hypothetical protein